MQGLGLPCSRLGLQGGLCWKAQGDGGERAPATRISCGQHFHGTAADTCPDYLINSEEDKGGGNSRALLMPRGKFVKSLTMLEILGLEILLRLELNTLNRIIPQLGSTT